MVTVGMTIEGTDIAKFIRNLPISEAVGSSRGGMGIAKNVLAQTKLNAPKDTGRLHDALAMKRLGKTAYQIYVGPIRPWGSRKSRMARKIYPLAQERGYSGHWVQTTMFPADSKIRKDLEARGVGRAFVRKFTPYMLPTLLKTMVKNKDILAKELTRELRKLKRRSKMPASRLNALNFAR